MGNLPWTGGPPSRRPLRNTRGFLVCRRGGYYPPAGAWYAPLQ